ncbi:MAG: flagellar hook protein FlgE [Defluviitaleaceae bacterium]|nr:flagellar hook protein FlgE [Defluviitaleaceae bacterium]
MMRSLFSGVSGLRVHQSRMDVIGNNIANVNTIGFKSSRMTFSDAMSQRIAAASGDNPETGRAGVNPMQIGLGANIGGIDNIMTQGAAQRTDRALDAAIQGNGFFVVSDVDGTYFTRAGNIDWNGNRFSIGGMQLMGWNAVPDPTRPGSYIVQQGTVEPLVTPASAHFMDPSATTLINAIGNLNINDLVDGHIIRPVEFFDSIGNRFTADVRFTFHPPDEEGSLTDNTTSTWTFNFLPMGDGDEPSDVTMIFPEGDRDRGMLVGLQIGVPEDILPGVAPGNSAMIDFSPANGRIHGIRVGDAPPTEDIARLEFALFFTVPALEPPSVIGEEGVVDEPPAFNSGFIRFNVDGLRQQMGQNTSFQALFADGNRPGTLEDISIGGDGIIMGRYSNGEMRPLGQIPLAQFLNPAGLERVGNNLWIPSANSGTFDGVGATGELMAGTLEMSNVELSGEFTDMITTQRGFQANSRVITTGDELLQELVNLKR